jgi:hypothetical protein
VSDVHEQPEDATRLTLTEQRELIPAHIAYRSELNEAEQANITRGQDWALLQLLDDVRGWIEYRSYPNDEIAVRFHHRLVQPGAARICRLRGTFGGAILRH